MGERSEAVFEQLAQRVAAPEARLLATTVRVALDLGGSVSEALLRLADSTRRRLEMLERIRALTAQGRLQGLVVGALPLLMLLVLQVMDGRAMRLLWTTPGGWAALAVLVALEACGYVLIRRIVRIAV
jgi:tight adherence protein B